MKIILILLIVLLIHLIQTLDLKARDNDMLSIGMTQQKLNTKDFYILNFGFQANGKKSGFNSYAEITGRIGITQILIQYDIKFGTTLYYAEDAIIGVRAFLLLGGDILFANYAGGGGIAAQVNLSEKIGLIGEFGYRGNMFRTIIPVTKTLSDQWFISGSYSKAGIALAF